MLTFENVPCAAPSWVRDWTDTLVPEYWVKPALPPYVPRLIAIFWVTPVALLNGIVAVAAPPLAAVGIVIAPVTDSGGMAMLLVSVTLYSVPAGTVWPATVLVPSLNFSKS